MINAVHMHFIEICYQYSNVAFFVWMHMLCLNSNNWMILMVSTLVVILMVNFREKFHGRLENCQCLCGCLMAANNAYIHTYVHTYKFYSAKNR